MRGIQEARKLAKQEILHPVQGIALKEAKRQNPQENDLLGWCLLSVRTWLGIRSKYKSAKEAWLNTPAEDKHTDPDSTPPAGAAIYWSIGKNWHIAMSDGDGYCISTDIKRRGKADRVKISRIHAQWGATYLGWAESLNGVRLFPKDTPAHTTPPTSTTGKYITVKRGDTLSNLAGDDWQKSWNDHLNSAVRHLRKKPENIQPGDRLWIDK